jgi:hypothetical protein
MTTLKDEMQLAYFDFARDVEADDEREISRPCCVSFDSGWNSAIEHALDLLSKAYDYESAQYYIKAIQQNKKDPI